MKREKVLASVQHMDERRAKYPQVAPLLEARYGRQVWRKRGSALDSLVATILSQNTTDKNSGKAFEQLLAKYDTYADVMNAPLDELIDVIRVAGLANQKAPRIQRSLRKIMDERGTFDLEFLGEMPADEAREWMTSIDGVGLKTASIVISFGFDGAAFPVDTHVNRVSQRIGFTPQGTTPDKAHYIMEAIVPPSDYFAFHIQLIQHGRTTCQARRPQCEQCPLTALCDHYKRQED